VANVPVSGDPPGSPPRQFGNRFANFFTSIASDVDDPAMRLQAIAAATVEAKRQLDLQGRDTLPKWLDRLPPAIAAPASGLISRRKRDHPEVADFNVVVSNVRVTESGWAFGGIPVEHVYMSGPVADGAGLNVTITGFGPHLHISLVANPASVDDPAEMADDMVAALDELVAAHDGVTAGAG
jgi:diacylglycerol O-acyltransferase